MELRSEKPHCQPPSQTRHPALDLSTALRSLTNPSVLLATLLLTSLLYQLPIAPLRPSHLAFSKSNSFKIAVFSDLHFGERNGLDWVEWGEEQDRNSTRVMKNVLKAEQPDFVVFNGDQVTGENLLAHNATSALTLALVPVLHKRIPFASIYGNHDQSVNISHTQLYNHEKKLARWTGLSHTGVNPSSAEEIDGAYNYVLPVRANLRSDKLEFILWFFDSRSGIFDDPARYEDWVDPLAATWLNSTASPLLKQHHLTQLPPSLIFVHIPPLSALKTQSQVVSPNASYPGLNDDNPLNPQGEHHPEVTAPDQPWWQAVRKTIGEALVAVVVGHDHGNDWCAKERAGSPTICFARHTGYGGYGTRPRGSRLFEIHRATKSSALTVRSWIRLEDDSVLDEIDLSIPTL